MIADQLAGLAAPLGPVRNLDVFATELLRPLRCERPGEPGWDDLAAVAEQARDGAHDRVAKEILSPRHTEAVLRLLRWFDGLGWRAAQAPQLSELPELTAPIEHDRAGPSRPAAAQGAQAQPGTSSGSRRKSGTACASPSKSYATRSSFSAASIRSATARRYVDSLKPVQDELGHANDVRVAYGLVIELGHKAEHADPIAEAGGQLLELHERALLQGEAKLHQRLRRLNRAGPFWRA